MEINNKLVRLLKEYNKSVNDYIIYNKKSKIKLYKKAYISTRMKQIASDRRIS